MYANTSLYPLYHKRIEKEIHKIVVNPPQGIFVLVDDENVVLLLVLVTGPTDTPYQAAMSSFLVGLTDEYPTKLPKVKFLTTNVNTFIHILLIRCYSTQQKGRITFIVPLGLQR